MKGEKWPMWKHPLSLWVVGVEEEPPNPPPPMPNSPILQCQIHQWFSTTGGILKHIRLSNFPGLTGLTLNYSVKQRTWFGHCDPLRRFSPVSPWPMKLDWWAREGGPSWWWPLLCETASPETPTSLCHWLSLVKIELFRWTFHRYTVGLFLWSEFRFRYSFMIDFMIAVSHLGCFLSGKVWD